MARKLTEAQVLKKLDIPDFRYMTKDKVIALASMYDRLAPEVAMKAIDQFPNFANVMKESVADLKGAVEKGIESGEKGTLECLGACKQVLHALEMCLEDGELTFEEKKYVMDQMQDVLSRMQELQKEHQHFIRDNLKYLATAVIGVGMIALGVLGGQAAFSLPNSTDIDDML